MLYNKCSIIEYERASQTYLAGDPGCITIAARCCQRNHYSRLLCSLYTCQRGRRYFPFGIKKCSINIDHKQLNTCCWRCFHDSSGVGTPGSPGGGSAALLSAPIGHLSRHH